MTSQGRDAVVRSMQTLLEQYEAIAEDNFDKAETLREQSQTMLEEANDYEVKSETAGARAQAIKEAIEAIEADTP